MHKHYCEDADLTAIALTLAVMENDQDAMISFRARLNRLAAERRLPADKTLLELSDAIVDAHDRRDDIRLGRNQRDDLGAMRDSRDRRRAK